MTIDQSNKLRAQHHIATALRLCGIPLGTPGSCEIVKVATWILTQQPMILLRFPTAQNDIHTLEGLNFDAYWAQKLQKFWHRAHILGLESPQARQAIAEYCTTSVGLMASVWRVYGAPDQSQVDHFGRAKIE